MLAFRAAVDLLLRVDVLFLGAAGMVHSELKERVGCFGLRGLQNVVFLFSSGTRLCVYANMKEGKGRSLPVLALRSKHACRSRYSYQVGMAVGIQQMDD